MQGCGWPGNVRELRNVVERAAILADDLIESSDLPMLKLADAISENDENVLRVKVGTRPSEVERLGINLKTLYNRLNMYQGHGHHGRPAKPEE